MLKLRDLAKPENQNQTLSVERISLVDSLGAQVTGLQDSISSKKEWIAFVETMLEKQQVELGIMIDALNELESSVHILKHVQGRPF